MSGYDNNKKESKGLEDVVGGQLAHTLGRKVSDLGLSFTHATQHYATTAGSDRAVWGRGSRSLLASAAEMLHAGDLPELRL